MYDSYDYNSSDRDYERPLTEAEIKARKIAEKRMQKEQRKKSGKGGAGKFFATLGLGLAFGIVAALAFKGTGLVFDKLTKADKKITAKQADDDLADVKDADKKASASIDKSMQDEIKDQIKGVLDSYNFAYDDGIEVKPFTYANGSVVDVVSKAMPSIVAITNKSIQEIPSFYGWGVQRYESEGGGSGIIVGQTDDLLLIVTNAHVVSSADTLTVMFTDSEAYEASIEGSDEINDIAVISVPLSNIKGSTLDAISTCKIGDSDALQIGEQVVAIGNALGYGQSVTTGIVSALNRAIANEGAGYIQTDAAINPGNSGGALLNMKGEVIGINTAKLANMKVEGMGYAIPISSAEPIIDDLMSLTTREKVKENEAGYLGISGLSVSQDISNTYNIPIGVYVQEVEKGKAADKAGIQSGDVIVKLDGIGMDSMKKLKERLLYYKAGERVEVVVKRVIDGKYKEVTTTVTLDSREGTALDPNKKGEDADDSKDEDVDDDISDYDDDAVDGDDDKDDGIRQKNGRFNFGNSTFEYSIPDIFDFFN